MNNRDGSLRADKSEENNDWLDRTVEWLTGEERKLRGFFRDKNGIFRVITNES